MGPPPPKIEEPQQQPPPPLPEPEPPDKVAVPEKALLAVTTTDLPLDTSLSVGENGGLFIIANEEAHVHLQYARLPKPIWPKSPVTIPSSFFRDIHRRVLNKSLTPACNVTLFSF